MIGYEEPQDERVRGFKRGQKPPAAIVHRLETGRLLPYQKHIYGVADRNGRALARSVLSKDDDELHKVLTRMEAYYRARLPDVYQALYAQAMKGNVGAARLFLERFDPKNLEDPEQESKNQEVIEKLKEVFGRIRASLHTSGEINTQQISVEVKPAPGRKPEGEKTG